MAAFCVLLVVDAEKFSAHRDAEPRDVHMAIREVLDEALKASDLVETWQAARFVENTGDGILAMLPAESAPRLMDHFPLCLQKELAERAPKLRAGGSPLRLRAALHIGLVDDEYSVGHFSAAAIDVNRLLDAEPLRAALSESDPDVTYAAFIVSAKLFNTYVAGGWTRLRESQFTEVRVIGKEYKGPAYLYVPTPSPGGTPRVPPSGALPPSPYPADHP
ncbi:MAG TPA: hypothetical protein VF069_01310 [Streptosporangiaceae bacterium]